MSFGMVVLLPYNHLPTCPYITLHALIGDVMYCQTINTLVLFQCGLCCNYPHISTFIAHTCFIPNFIGQWLSYNRYRHDIFMSLVWFLMPSVIIYWFLMLNDNLLLSDIDNDDLYWMLALMNIYYFLIPTFIINTVFRYPQ